jgi:hypothetical protein
MTATTAREFLQKQSLRPSSALKRERDMLARQLAEASKERARLAAELTNARVLLTMGMAALKPYEAHIEPRRVRRRIKEYFQIPAEVEV